MHSYSRRGLIVAVVGLALILSAGLPGLASDLMLPFTVQTGDAKQNLSWVPGDSHHHSTYSDGLAPVEQVMTMARDAGLTWIIFAEHAQNMSTELLAKEWTEVEAAMAKTGVVGVVGEEIGSVNVDGTNGHMVAINLRAHKIDDNKLLEGDLMGAVAKQQPNDPVIGIIAHPAQRFHEWRTWGRQLIGGIELISGTRSRPAPTIALSRWQWYTGRQLAMNYFGRNLTVGTGGSDGHRLEDIGGDLPATYLSLPEGFNAQDVLRAISAGKAIVSSRYGLLADFTLNDTPVGGLLSLRLGQPLAFKARFVYGDGSFKAGLAEIRVIQGRVDGTAAVIYKQTFKDPLGKRPARLELPVPAKFNIYEPCYYRLEVVFQSSGDSAVGGKETKQYVYTNPIYVKPLFVPICVLSDATPLNIESTEKTPGISFTFNYDPESTTGIEAKVMLDTTAAVGTTIQIMLDQTDEKKNILASPILGRKKGDGGFVSYRVDMAKLPAGRYTLYILAKNQGTGKGTLVSQSFYFTWVK